MRSASLVFFSVLLFALPSSAQTTCPNPGDQLITTKEARDLATRAGIPSNVNCWNPSNPYAGADAGAAKQYLRSILCRSDGDNYGGFGPDQTVEKLDGKFSVCAAKFLKAARDNGINVCVKEGARTVQKQQEYVSRGVLACNKGAACEHPRGIAIDVNVVPSRGCTSYLPLHQAAGQFGIVFYLGCRDAYHMVPARGGNCNSGGIFQPDFPAYYQQSPFQAPLSTSMPVTPMSAAPVAQPTTQTPTTQTQDQTQICTPKYSCSANTMYYHTTACKTEVYQICAFGCDGEKCKTSQSGTSSTSTSSGSNTTSGDIGKSVDIASSSSDGNSNANDNSNDNSTSVSDILNSLIKGSGVFSSVDIGTSTSVTLNPGTKNDIGTLVVDGVKYPAGTVFASGTITSVQPVGSQSTFTSGDLGYGAVSSYNPAPQSLAVTVLEGMKQALLGALNFLRTLTRF